VGTWETHNVPEKVWDTKPINGEVNQMTLWESDKPIVAKKQGNACGAKGLTGKPMEGDTTSAVRGG